MHLVMAKEVPTFPVYLTAAEDKILLLRDLKMEVMDTMERLAE